MKTCKNIFEPCLAASFLAIVAPGGGGAFFVVLIGPFGGAARFDGNQPVVLVP